MPALGRFLIVVTFLEDALRIVTQFGDQIYYLTTYRRFLPWGIAHIFLIANVCVWSPVELQSNERRQCWQEVTWLLHENSQKSV
jgi:SURF4 family